MRHLSDFDKAVFKHLSMRQTYNFIPDELVFQYIPNEVYLLMEDRTTPEMDKKSEETGVEHKSYKMLIAGKGENSRETVLNILFKIKNVLDFLVSENILKE